MAGFYGNIGVMVRAAAYIRAMGSDGLALASKLAVLNANYLRASLRDLLDIPYGGLCKHEFVLSARSLKEKYGISATDIAKGLIDRGIHPPTVYFPLIVHEALMVEPTETENKETLDHFVKVMTDLVRQAGEDPEALKKAPTTTPVGRLDEVLGGTQAPGVPGKNRGSSGNNRKGAVTRSPALHADLNGNPLLQPPPRWGYNPDEFFPLNAGSRGRQSPSPGSPRPESRIPHPEKANLCGSFCPPALKVQGPAKDSQERSLLPRGSPPGRRVSACQVSTICMESSSPDSRFRR